MAAFAFETITEAQALAFSSFDRLTLASGSAKTTTVLFLPDGTYSVTIADRTVIFSAEFRSLSPTRLPFPDGSELFVGTSAADNRDQAFAGQNGGAMYGGDGADSLTGNRSAWLIQGNQGDDQISVYASFANTIYGGQGNDAIRMIFAGGGNDRQFAQGNKGNDNIQGGAVADTLLGGQGNDTIDGLGGTGEFINGNLGNDNLTGSGQIFGEDGNDLISLSPLGPGTVRGGEGNDIITIGGDSAHPFRNEVSGDGGDDSITSVNLGVDEIHGGDGADRIAIINNADVVAPGAGDLLFGEAGNDSIRGGNGADLISGGAGADTLTGGDGADTFILDASSTVTAEGADQIHDWSVTDKIQLRAPGAAGYTEISATNFTTAAADALTLIAAGQVEVVAVQVGLDVIIFADASATNTIDTATILVGRSLADLSAANFV